MLLRGLARDLRHALRVMRTRTGHSAVSAATIALGMAAVTVMSSLVWSTLLRPLPWPEADRLVRVYETRQGGTPRFGPTATNAGYLAWREAATTVEDLAAWRRFAATVSGGADAERLRIASVTASLFTLLRARPHVGGLFAASDEADPPSRIVLLSHGLWQRRFGGSADAIGRVMRLDGEPHTIAGVMPPGFAFPDASTEAWVPLHVPPLTRPGSEGTTLSMMSVMGRLAPGATPERAAAEATARARTAPDAGMVAEMIFGSRGPVDVSVVPALEAATGEVRPALLVLLAAVALLLVTAAANVASVQLAAATTRRREVAIRTALGADPATVTRQFLVEYALVGAIGGACGVLLAIAAHAALPALLPADFPRVHDIRPDWPVVAVAAVVALGISLACALLPALQARTVDVRGALAEDGQGTAGAGRGSRTRRARLVVMGLQVAVAAVLLVGASLLVRSFVALLHVDRGYDPASAVAAVVPMPSPTYTPARRLELLTAAVDRLSANPGVAAAGFTTILPLSGSEAVRGFQMPRRRGEGDPSVSVQAAFRIVSPGYFAALGMRVAQGRGFDETDSATSRRVVVVNEAFARTYLGPSPLDEPVPAGRDEQPWSVVGVVEDVRGHEAGEARPEIFVSAAQWDDGIGMQEPALVVRAAAAPATAAAAIRTAVRELDPDLALASVATMEDRLHERLATPRLYAVVLATFAAFALAIAAVGLFGVLSYLVAQRSRELAIRSALGATAARIALLVVGEGLLVAALGLAVGIACAAAAARGVAHLLYGFSPWDLASYGLVVILLLAAAALACVLPARRAAKVNPIELLKQV
jgi:putative ABC transport system permease protein